MRRTLSFVITCCWVLLAVNGCGSGSPGRLDDRLVQPLETFPVDPELACPDRRWIAIKKDPRALCPDPAEAGLTGWRVEPLWWDGLDSERGNGGEAAEPSAEGRHGESRGGEAGTRKGRGGPALATCDPDSLYLPMSCFCRYAAEGEGGDLLTPFGELASHGLLAMARDCMAVVPAQAGPGQPAAPGSPPIGAADSTSLAAARAGALERRFLAQAGRFERRPAAAGLGAAGPGAASVRLAVVDTAPTNEVGSAEDPFNSPHGYVLIHMARKLLADPGAAPTATAGVRVTSRLTLRFLTLDPALPGGGRTDPGGGFFGSIGDLARDLRAEVADWQADLATGGETNLILNLSLGWHEQYNALAPTAVAAVRAALADAVCRGALPIAAAGNQDWGSAPTSGPLFPAAWEAEAAPAPGECAELLGAAAPVSYARGGYRPLVYAVGAVGAAGDRLPLARRDAEPRLVAFGDHGLVVTPRAAEALTGSSVAALITSATAAASWTGQADLGAFELMEQIYDASQLVDPPRAADFTLAGRTANVRRVFACPVATAIGAPLATCPGEAAAAVAGRSFPSKQAGPLARFEPKERRPPFGGPVQTIDLGGYTREARSPAGCPPTAILDPDRPEASRERIRVLRSSSSSARIRFPCPQWQAPAQWANAWVNPQPGSNQCPTCGIEDGSPIGTAYLEIDSQAAIRRRLGLPDPALANPVLKVGATVYLLEELRLDGPPPIRVLIEGVPLGDGAQPRVFFSLLLDGQLSSTSLLLGPEGLERH